MRWHAWDFNLNEDSIHGGIVSISKWYIGFKDHVPGHIRNSAIHYFRHAYGLRCSSFNCLPFDDILLAEEINRDTIVLIAAICAQDAAVKFGSKPCNKVLKLGRRSILVCRRKNSNVVGLAVNKCNQVFVPVFVLRRDGPLRSLQIIHLILSKGKRFLNYFVG